LLQTIPRPFRLILAVTLLAIACTSAGAVAEEPVDVDYSKIAFYPDRWKRAGASFKMQGWKGRHVVLIARRGKYNAKLMRSFTARLDGGWKTYTELVGRSPRMTRQVDGKATICALPAPRLSCGMGCGYVGSTGIEVAAFYQRDLPAFTANPESFAHYYFYEMGRNFFVYGHRHSLFTTGYAVFMRYVCMDKLKCVDNDIRTRRVIERCEQVYADSNLRFLDTFTNLTGGEKSNRLKDPRTGRTITPSDQPVMYATAMLKLRKDYGGDAWVKKFLRVLQNCPAVRAVDRATALRQCMNWLVCASAAAGADLSEVFAGRWRMPLTAAQRNIMKNTAFGAADFQPGPVIKQLNAASGG